jgi:hypothetical protein
MAGVLGVWLVLDVVRQNQLVSPTPASRNACGWPAKLSKPTFATSSPQLNLPHDTNYNRRVLAVLTYLR